MIGNINGHAQKHKREQMAPVREIITFWWLLVLSFSPKYAQVYSPFKTWKIPPLVYLPILSMTLNNSACKSASIGNMRGLHAYMRISRAYILFWIDGLQL